MAVLHHAFRCPVTPEFTQQILKLSIALEAGDRAGISTLASDGYASIANRRDIQAAFHLYPDGAAVSWMQPEFISPGLAAIAALAPRFSPIPNLSASKDTNHHLLEMHLPLLGFSEAEVGFLVRGQPIEAMLQACDGSMAELKPGGFRHTGGWTAGDVAQRLSARLSKLNRGVSSDTRETSRSAWLLLQESGALADAGTMLAEIGADDWLVMAITH
jgi:hypothetical protein